MKQTQRRHQHGRVRGIGPEILVPHCVADRGGQSRRSLPRSTATPASSKKRTRKAASN